MNTKIYHVIILDKSGSMSSIAEQAISGVNETLGSIKSMQQKESETQHYVTLVAFCGCELRTIFDTVPALEAHDITSADYQPCCMTPLYDAIGNTITKLHKIIVEDENSAASVTIITDGYENASKEFSGIAIKSLIEAYKNEGWLFAYIGTDHDVKSVSFRLSIDNTMQFDKTPEGTHAMFLKQNEAREEWSCYMLKTMNNDNLTKDEKKNIITKENKKYFGK